MEMHSRQSLYEIHGISIERRRRRSRLTARLLMRRIGAFLAKVTRSIETELAIRRAMTELAGMDDRTLRDLGIARNEIESVLRRPRANTGIGDTSAFSHEAAQSEADLPTVQSPLIVAEGRSEQQQSRGFARTGIASVRR